MELRDQKRSKFTMEIFRIVTPDFCFFPLPDGEGFNEMFYLPSGGLYFVALFTHSMKRRTELIVGNRRMLLVLFLVFYYYWLKMLRSDFSKWSRSYLGRSEIQKWGIYLKSN